MLDTIQAKRNAWRARKGNYRVWANEAAQAPPKYEKY
jgi:hypothetical protein